MPAEINEYSIIETVSRHARVRFNVKSNAKGDFQFDATLEASDSVDNIDELIAMAEHKLDEVVSKLSNKYLTKPEV